MSLLALDIDQFKAINDERGHDAGDAVLEGMGDPFRERFADGEGRVQWMKGADDNLYRAKVEGRNRIVI